MPGYRSVKSSYPVACETETKTSYILHVTTFLSVVARKEILRIPLHLVLSLLTWALLKEIIETSALFEGNNIDGF